MLYSAGDTAAKVHRVVSGVVALSISMPNGRRQIVDFLLVGDVCSFIHSDGTYVFDCEAITEATTCTVDAKHMRELMSARCDVRKVEEKEMVLACNRMGEHLVTIGQLSASERLLHFLHWLEGAHAQRGLPTRPLTLTMSRSDIADYLGMQMETVSRAFTELKRRNLIDLPHYEQVVLPRGERGALSMAKAARMTMRQHAPGTLVEPAHRL